MCGVFEHFSRTYFENYLQTPTRRCVSGIEIKLHMYIYIQPVTKYIYVYASIL